MNMEQLQEELIMRNRDVAKLRDNEQKAKKEVNEWMERNDELVIKLAEKDTAMHNAEALKREADLRAEQMREEMGIMRYELTEIKTSIQTLELGKLIQEEKSQQYEKERESLQSTIALTTANFEDVVKVAEQKEASWKTKRSDWDEERKRLSQEISSANAMVIDQGISFHEDIDQLKHRLSKKEEEQSRRTSILEEKNNETENLRAQIRVAEERCSEVAASLNAELRGHREEIKQLEEMLEDGRRRKKEEDAVILLKHEETMDKLVKEHDSVKSLLNDGISEWKKKEAKFEVTRKLFDTVREQCSEKEARITELGQERDVLQTDKAQLETQLQNVRAELRNQSSFAEEQARRHKEESNGQIRDISLAHSQSDMQLNDQIRNLQAELESMNSLSSRKDEELEEQQSIARRMSDENVLIRSELATRAKVVETQKNGILSPKYVDKTPAGFEAELERTTRLFQEEVREAQSRNDEFEKELISMKDSLRETEIDWKKTKASEKDLLHQLEKQKVEMDELMLKSEKQSFFDELTMKERQEQNASFESALYEKKMENEVLRRENDMLSKTLTLPNPMLDYTTGGMMTRTSGSRTPQSMSMDMTTDVNNSDVNELKEKLKERDKQIKKLQASLKAARDYAREEEEKLRIQVTLGKNTAKVFN